MRTAAFAFGRPYRTLKMFPFFKIPTFKTRMLYIVILLL